MCFQTLALFIDLSQVWTSYVRFEKSEDSGTSMLGYTFVSCVCFRLLAACRSFLYIQYIYIYIFILSI